MPQESIFARAEKATVWFPRNNGLGVLVTGPDDGLAFNKWIITAAHCIHHDSEGGMVLGDYYLEKVRITDAEFTVRPLAVEPVSDIAIVGAPDNQEFGNEADAFLAICDGIEPVPVCQREYKFGEKFPVHVWTHKGTWITGEATSWSPQALWMIDPDQGIESGTSGGPIINDDGELVGIVSNASDVIEDGITEDGLSSYEGYITSGTFPYPALALPTWACRELFYENQSPSILDDDPTEYMATLGLDVHGNPLGYVEQKPNVLKRFIDGLQKIVGPPWW